MLEWTRGRKHAMAPKKGNIPIELVFRALEERGYMRKPGVESLADRYKKVMARLLKRKKPSRAGRRRKAA